VAYLVEIDYKETLVTDKISLICRISQYLCYFHLYFAPLELDFFVQQYSLQIYRPACCGQASLLLAETLSLWE